MHAPSHVIEVANVSKAFSGVKALINVTLGFHRGRVHVLMGENGAGKSTLMKILSGIYHPDAGEVRRNGRAVKYATPRDALSDGISMIHQELSPARDMTVAENIFLGHELFRGKGFILDEARMRREARDLMEDMGVVINPSRTMRELTIAQTQMVEIAKAIGRNSEIIIMDEPTSAITTREVDILFEQIARIKIAGRSIVYITHKMDEVFRVADDITVLRDGRLIGTYSAGAIDTNRLITLMVDREISEIYPVRHKSVGEVKLSVRGLTRDKVFADVSFDARRGEILGLAGLMGAGRTEVVEAIFGLARLDRGRILIDGREVCINRPATAIAYKIGMITEDRKTSGLVMTQSVKENLTLASLRGFTRAGLLNHRAESGKAHEYVDTLRVKTPDLNHPVENLSGGNQQKVIIAKWLMTLPEILILDEPTRGIDVGAKAEVYQLILRFAQEGKTILFISSEMEEILGISDRVIVFHEGRIRGELSREDATQELVLKYATGTM
jgi:inositol transport system ATP-binding protein